MEQSQFNHIIYFHLRCYMLELACEVAEGIKQQYCINQHNADLAKRIITESNINLSPEELVIFDGISISAAKARNDSVEAHHKAQILLTNARNELSDYLNLIQPNIKSRARQIVEEIALKAKNVANKYHKENPTQKDQRREKFIEYMYEELSRVFDCKFTYKQPVSNGLFMQIMAHQVTRSAAAIVLLAGIGSLIIGSLALGGVIPVAATITAALLTAGGLSAAASGSILTAGFFRQRSPFEIDQGKEPLQLPMQQMSSV